MSDFSPRYIKNDQITFKYAKGVSDRSGKEFHTYHEIIYFIGGEARFISENIHAQLKPNTLILIPCETYHQLLITGSQKDYHRCVFQFFNIDKLQELISGSMQEILLLDMNSQFRFLFNKMIALTEKHGTESINSIVLQSVLSLLLSEIILNDYSSMENTATIPYTISEKAIAYISGHIGDPISVADIAKELNVSVSCLAHTFKEQMNISLHRYILKKRLIMAHHRILSGDPATKAAMDCGFSDYSGFYKQYKKMFNKTPSSKERDFFR